MYEMATPEDYIWKSPGMPSLLQTYNKSDFFYFSPAIGLGLVTCLEYFHHDRKVLGIAQGVIIVCVSFLYIITRKHFFVDIFGGLILGHYMWMMAGRVAPWVDYGIFGIPFSERYPKFVEQKCFKCDNIMCCVETEESEDVNLSSGSKN
jgi:hypothetical protein